MTDKLILGTVQLGIRYGVNNTHGQVSQQEAFAILGKAFENGIHTLDTAAAYGSSHAVIGAFHRQSPSRKYQIITKLPRSFDTGNLANIIESYCSELNVNKIDVLMFHGMESYYTGKDVLDELIAVKEKNIIDKIGVSVYTNEEADIICGDANIDVVQIPFNLLDNIFTRGAILRKMKDHQKIVHTRSVFLQGLLFLDRKSNHPAAAALRPYLDQLSDIAESYQVTLPELALSYCLLQQDIDKVLIGVDSVGQLNTNLRSAAFRPSSEMIAKIDNIQVTEQRWLNPTKW